MLIDTNRSRKVTWAWSRSLANSTRLWVCIPPLPLSSSLSVYPVQSWLLDSLPEKSSLKTRLALCFGILTRCRQFVNSV